MTVGEVIVRGVDVARLRQWLKKEVNGHRIFIAETFTGMGFPEWFVVQAERTHASSDDDVKETVFIRDCNDRVLVAKSVRGVQDLEFLRHLGAKLGLDFESYPYGRGSEARMWVEAILAFLDERGLFAR